MKKTGQRNARYLIVPKNPFWALTSTSGTGKVTSSTIFFLRVLPAITVAYVDMMEGVGVTSRKVPLLLRPSFKSVFLRKDTVKNISMFAIEGEQYRWLCCNS